jgi:branched-chain amino acid transport system permease protein
MRLLNTLLSGISTGLVYALIALAIVLVWRSSRAINFAQAGQATLTTYIALTVQRSTGNWVLAMTVAIVAGFLIGAAVYLLVSRALRTQGTSGALIATLGVLVIVESITGLVWGEGIQNFAAPVSTTGFTFGETTIFFSRYDMLVISVGALLVIGLSLLFQRTRLGLSMRAAAFNAEVARLSGVRVNRMLLMGWALAGSIGAVAGVLIAPLQFLSPVSFAVVLIFAFTAAVIGGLDSPLGAILGGLSTGVLLALITGYTDSSNAPLAALVVLTITLLLHPSGLFGTATMRRV